MSPQPNETSPQPDPQPVDNRIDGVPLRNVSPWSTQHKIARLAWALTERLLFRYSFHTMYRFRAFLLRTFGAKLGENVRVRRTAHIEIPWHLTCGDDSSIGDYAIIYSLGKITLGDRTSVSQYAHLCAGTHDYTSSDYPLLRPPIVLGTDCWVAADAFIGPGVTLGDGVVVGARSNVFKDLPAWTVCMGSPARPVKERHYDRRPKPHTPITGLQ